MSIFFLLCVMLFAEPYKIYYYTTDKHIENFKTLKVKFDHYLSKYGNYEFQAFSDKEVFEDFLEERDNIVMLSSLHYVRIAQKYNLQAVYVAQNKKSIQDSNIIVGKKGVALSGVITSAFSEKYTKKLLRKMVGLNALHVLQVPKDIDALMSVGYGMSQFASVSKSSFRLLQKSNRSLTKDMNILSESDPTYRMLIATNKKSSEDKELVGMFTTMNRDKNGKEVLSILGIDNIVKLNKMHLRDLRSVK